MGWDQKSSVTLKREKGPPTGPTVPTGLTDPRGYISHLGPTGHTGHTGHTGPKGVLQSFRNCRIAIGILA